MQAESLAVRLARLPMEAREEVLASLSADQLLALRYDWAFWARPGQLPPPGEWDVWLLSAGRGYGKALAVDTPIPTPDGWRPIGALEDGDAVFDENGKVCRVLKAHRPYVPSSCYELTFDDGSRIVCDADHLWVTQTYVEKKRERNSRHEGRRRPPLPERSLRTTREIVETIGMNHYVPCARPLDLPDADLPCDPYTLGAWLGDGSKMDSSICGTDDEIFEEIGKAYELVELRRDPRQPALRQAKIGWRPPARNAKGYSVVAGPFDKAIRVLGVRDDKHVPDAFKRASVEQRLALLQGIMDTDGGVHRSGMNAYVGFVSERLRDDVAELLVSLGYKVRKRTDLKGVAGCPSTRKPFFSLSFRPIPEMNPFRLSRKRTKVVPFRAQRSRHEGRFIKAARLVAPRPVRCLTVNSPSGMYLCGESMIPTHNTRTGAEMVNMWARDNPIIHLVGRTAGDVRDIMIEGESGILACASPWFRPSYNPSLRRVTWPNGAKALVFTSAEPEELRGPQCVAPETLVLRADLRWVRADSLKPGDRLVTFDEEVPRRGGERRLRVGIVTHASARTAERVRVVTDQAEIVASVEHPFLRVRSGQGGGGRSFRPIRKRSSRDPARKHAADRWWVEAGDLIPGDAVVFLRKPWETDESWFAGWLAVMCDGEGWMEKATVLKVEPIGSGPVVTLSTTTRTLITNGFATHNCYKAWADEPATWGKTPKRGLETWTNMMLGLRLGPAPQVIATTTPKNTPLIRMLLEMADPARREATRRAGRETLRVVLTTGSTYENIHNLPPSFIQNIVQQYEGTRIGQQELHAVLLSDDPRALWKRARIDELRVEEAPPLRRVCVGVDPSGSVGEHASACGIVAAGEGDDGRFYVLADATLVGTPAQWGATVIALYEQLGANAIVAEKNFGGLMVEHTILSMADPGRPRPKVELVVSSRGKYLRAEPVSVLYEQHPGRVYHVGVFPELEDQMVTWVPGERSPDRLDALVFAITWLLALDRPRYMTGARPYGIF